MSNRTRAIESPATAVMERTFVTGNPPVAASSSRWIDRAMSRGSRFVRTIHVSGSKRTLSAVTPSGTCAIGTYIAGRGGLLSA